jgi:ribulose bisphosphate carboxylase small subunit
VGTINYLQAIKPDTAYIKKIIINSLLFDWAIRIEYHDVKAGAASWQLWDKPFFALRSASSVVESLMKCYMKNPGCIIRINAEKFRPQSQLLFTVYNPGFVPGVTMARPDRTQPWLPPEDEALPARQRLIS